MSQTLKTQQPSDVTRPVQHTAVQGKGTQAMTDGNLASLTTVHTALTRRLSRSTGRGEEECAKAA